MLRGVEHEKSFMTSGPGNFAFVASALSVMICLSCNTTLVQ